MKPARLLTTVLAVACTAFGVVFASGVSAATNTGADTCLACHADKDFKNAAGSAISVEAEAFAKSVHGQAQLACTACHQDINPQKLPHADKLKPVNCATCHDKQVKEYAATVHGKARKDGNNVAATCVDCHGKHDIRHASDPESRTNHAKLEATCGKCHGNDTLVQQAKLPGGNIVSQFHDSIHGKALKGAAQSAAPTCTDCHGTHSIRAKDDAESKTNRARIPDTCGACHRDVKAVFNQSQHGKLRQEGNLAAPGCNDCHTAHQIQPHDHPKFVTEVIEQCGTCHAQYLTTYRDTYHGQVTGLGYAQMATCASCHGSHAILPASNPASTVSAQNRAKTCQTCHPGASANFAKYDPHANRHDRARNPVYFYTANFMGGLLLAVFGFFGLHTVLWLVRSLIDQRNSARGAGGAPGKE